MRHYHISSKELSWEFEFTPRIPDSKNHFECQTTPRVCFAPSVWQCMIGVVGTGKASGIIMELVTVARRNRTLPVVYETRKKLHKPETVSDFAETGEMWSLVPILCQRKGYIDLEYLIRTGKVRVIQRPYYNVPDDLFTGWKAGMQLSNRDWKENPPVKTTKGKSA